MTQTHEDQARTFRRLHDPGQILLLANAWDAGSARLIEACGAKAIATTSAGLAWSRGYPDGGGLPPRVLGAAVEEIVRVLSVPLSVDFEDGYSAEPKQVAEAIAPLLASGAVGINLEDGAGTPDLLCAKIEAVKGAARRAGVDLFVNARTDVYLHGLVPADRALAETLERGHRYRAAGADGFFVPRIADEAAMRAVASEIPLPLNVLLFPGLPAAAELTSFGVRRVSAGSGLTQLAYGVTRRAATTFLAEGRYEPIIELAAMYPEMNKLFRRG